MWSKVEEITRNLFPKKYLTIKIIMWLKIISYSALVMSILLKIEVFLDYNVKVNTKFYLFLHDSMTKCYFILSRNDLILKNKQLMIKYWTKSRLIGVLLNSHSCVLIKKNFFTCHLSQKNTCPLNYEIWIFLCFCADWWIEKAPLWQ